MKGSKAARWPLACSQNKGLCPSGYQRTERWLLFRALPPQRQRGRCVTARAGRQRAAAISAPETAYSTKVWAGCQLLTTSSWDPGWLTSARSVKVWDQLPRGDTRHTQDCALAVHARNWAAGTREVHKMHGPPGTVCLPSTQSPEWLVPGEGTKCRAHLGLWLCRAPKNLSDFDLGSTLNAGSIWDRALAKHPGAWAMWTHQVHATLGCGKPTVVQPLWAHPTYASSICLQCPFLSTAQLNKWAWISGHLGPLVSGQKFDTEETSKQRKPK